jgi:hypothetical protein
LVLAAAHGGGTGAGAPAVAGPRPRERPATAGRRRAAGSRHVKAARAGAIAKAIQATAARSLILATVGRIGSRRNVAADARRSGQVARFAGARTRGRAAGALRADARDTFGVGRAGGAVGFESTASTAANCGRLARRGCAAGQSAGGGAAGIRCTGPGHGGPTGSLAVTGSGRSLIAVSAAGGTTDRPRLVASARPKTIAGSIGAAGRCALLGTVVVGVGAIVDFAADSRCPRQFARATDAITFADAADAIDTKTRQTIIGHRARTAGFKPQRRRVGWINLRVGGGTVRHAAATTAKPASSPDARLGVARSNRRKRQVHAGRGHGDQHRQPDCPCARLVHLVGVGGIAAAPKHFS